MKESANDETGRRAFEGIAIGQNDFPSSQVSETLFIYFSFFNCFTYWGVSQTITGLIPANHLLRLHLWQG